MNTTKKHLITNITDYIKKHAKFITLMNNTNCDFLQFENKFFKKETLNCYSKQFIYFIPIGKKHVPKNSNILPLTPNNIAEIRLHNLKPEYQLIDNASQDTTYTFDHIDMLFLSAGGNYHKPTNSFYYSSLHLISIPAWESNVEIVPSTIFVN